MSIQKLETAYFYNSSQRDIIADISLLTDKLYKERNRILVCCKDDETVKVIDDFLWKYKEDAFIPHSINQKEQSSVYPILITTEIDENYKHNTLLVLNGILLQEKDWQKFTKVYYFFDDQENEERKNARFMWKSFSTVNVVCKYWVTKENKWILARSS